MHSSDFESSRRGAKAAIARLKQGMIHLFYRRTILLLVLLFAASIAAALLNMSHLSTNLVKEQALQNAMLYAQAIQEARTLYSSEVVDRLSTIQKIHVTHDYHGKRETIPLPVNFLIDLGQRLEAKNPGMMVRLYSEYPFPWRKAEGGPKDTFERDALNYLKANPQRYFSRFEPIQGHLTLRFAQADIMQQTCVKCHNTHPNSPKTDWQVGDVRGVLEISTSLDRFMQKTRSGIRSTTIMMAILAVFGVSGIALVISRLRQVSRELEHRVNERTAELQQTNEQLLQEQEKSDRLLLNILPEAISKRLKEGQGSIADGFPEATILFADIVNFTPLSAQIAPLELVELLNQIFSAFDRLTEQYGLEKIKTIGDAYMVVGGLPTPRPDHAEAVANMALGMQQEIDRFHRELNLPLNIRIGINTGPVVAGVIGTKKFIYDLWGDTVNVASRMESQGIAGSIQVTQATYEHLQHRYHLQPRGMIVVKGKGEMMTYLLQGIQQSSALKP
jgi:class 3 adenylate cyclase/type II secretory pathway pseudopilin PulG